MEKTVIQAGKIAASFVGRRWRLWEWVNGKIERTLSDRKPIHISSLQDLWKKAFSRDLVDGDYIILMANNEMAEGWYLSEWVPKAPGQIWSESNLINLDPNLIASGFRTGLGGIHALPKEVRCCFVDNNLYEHSHWEMQYSSKLGLAQQGFGHRLGVYRPPINDSNEDHYALLSVCSGKEYMIDLGFPVIVSKQVYRKYLESSKLENSVEVEGVIRIREMGLSDAFSRYIRTAGSSTDEPFSDLIQRPVAASNVVGEIISPLDVTTRINGTHPIMTLRVDGFNIDEDSKNDVPSISRFIVTNPRGSNYLELPPGPARNRGRFGLNFLLEDDYQFGTTMSPATDFDGRIVHYQCEYPIGKNPLNLQTG